VSDVGTHLSEAGTACYRLFSRDLRPKNWSSAKDCKQAIYGPIGDDGYFKPLFDPSTGAIDHGVAAYWKERSDLNQYLQHNWSRIGSKLAGKLHIWTGDMDTYYLNNAVYLLKDFLKTTSAPPWGGSIRYGPRQPHCWAGPLSLADRLKGSRRKRPTRHRPVLVAKVTDRPKPNSCVPRSGSTRKSQESKHSHSQ
jgi:hypothetical protein